MDSESHDCERCGLLFNTVTNLVKHMKERHWDKPINPSSIDCANIATGGENEHCAGGNNDKVEENDDGAGDRQEQFAFTNMFCSATDLVRETPEWEDQYDQQKIEADDDNEAQGMADDKMNEEIVSKAVNIYQDQIENDLLLRNSDVHASVTNVALKYWNKGYSSEKCARMAVKKHRIEIDELMTMSETDSDSEDEDLESEDGVTDE